jgi:adenylate kinase family enzyme
MTLRASTKRVHVFGASGAGTSTLGRELARRHGLNFFDTDDFYWQTTDPPYQQPHPREVRQRSLRDALNGSDGWVLAGSLCGWGDFVIPMLDLAIFVVVDLPLRLTRLRQRNVERYGARVALGGDLYEQHQAFLKWASSYEEGSVEMRSQALHEQWLLHLPCQVRRVDGSRSLDELCMQAIDGWVA